MKLLDRVSVPVLVVVLVAVAFVAGAGMAVLVAESRESPAVPVVGDTMQVQVWEDGSARVLSGTADIGGEPWDLTGMTFCLYGQGCTDTGVRAVSGPVDGHAPCWEVIGQNITVVCADGYHVARPLAAR